MDRQHAYQHSMQPQRRMPPQVAMHPQVVLPPPPPEAFQQAFQHAQIVQPDIPQQPAIDYPLLLLKLAENYVAEAQNQASLIAYNRPSANIDAYSKVMATALGCYEAVLRMHRPGLQPRQEALTQLRYANLLYQVTTNNMLTEELLSKAIPFCERNRLFDIKYSMQHLLVRVLFRSKSKAGLKYLDNLLNDVTANQHTLHAVHDMHAALNHIHTLYELARRKGDSAIAAASSLLEAIIRLRIRTVDSMSEAQTALASARAGLMQQNEGEAEVPQLHILLHYLDIACSLDPSDATQSKAKMEKMQETLDKMLDTTSTWSSDGSIPVPIKNATPIALTQSTDGIFTKGKDGRDRLSLSWLPRLEVYLLAFILSGITIMNNPNQPDSTRALKFLDEGLRVCDDDFQYKEACVFKSLTSACQGSRWRQLTKCHLLGYVAVTKCRDSRWDEALAHLQDLLKILDTPGLNPNEDQKRLANYLSGLVQHSTGNLDGALASYNDPLLALPQPNDKTSSYLHHELAVLAKLNTLVIIRPPNHPSHDQISTILSSLAPHFPKNTTTTATAPAQPTTAISQNPHLVAAHAFLQTIFSPNAILDTKAHLRRSLGAAQRALNRQLIALGSAYLYSYMFTGIVGDEAMNFAKAAQATAKSAGGKTWLCVADGLLAGALELEGRSAEAGAVRGEAETLMPFLPGALGAMGQ